MELTLTEFVVLTLLASGGLIVVFTVISRTLHLRAETRALGRRIVCRLCLHAFEDAGHQKTVPCPHCGAANERGRSRRLG